MSRAACYTILSGLLIMTAGLDREAFATHEVDHRYTVVGEVRTADGEPVAGESVKVSAGGGQLIKEAWTDAEGRYRVLLHLHNTDRGKVFDVVVRDRARTARVEFNSHDRATERGLRLDFVVADEPEGKERARVIIVPEQ